MGTVEGNRYLYLTTPLGEDKLLLSGFTGQEGLSRLFHFELDLLADLSTVVEFDKLIGQKVSFGIQGTDSRQPARDLHGIVTEFSQGKRDFSFTEFKMTIVPAVWTLTRKFRSRIFQHITIPDLLKKLFEGFDVLYELQGTYEPREYVTQYQESDFAFASRLMEEEGIFYLFKFTPGAHKMVVADSSQSHPDIPGDSKLIFETMEGGERDEERIRQWRKAQIWDSGKYALWDHKFQLPHKHLEAEKIVKDSVQVGKVSHKLKLAGNEDMEILEHPGRYALRFDGIDKGGAPAPDRLGEIFQDNKRTTDLRMQLAESGMIAMEGASNCRQITAGHKFNLQRHFDGNGQYVITNVSHDAAEGSFRAESGTEGENHYGNTFSAQPFELPYRPSRDTASPTISGPTTAVVVGPSGEEIFTDPYGRVKVKFMWDPAADSTDTSCWARVATSWAGQNWGSIHLPRIGQEVIVIFENGDPDHPLVIGSVYNPDQMPPYTLPDHKTVSTIKSRSSKQGTKNNYNEFRFEDLKGKEQVFVHAERDKDERVKAESREVVGGNRHLIVEQDQKEVVGVDKHSTVKGNCRFTTEGERHVHVKKKVRELYEDVVQQKIYKDHKLEVYGNQNRTVNGDVKECIMAGSESMVLNVGNTYHENSEGSWTLNCPTGLIYAKGQSIDLTANPNGLISLSVGSSCITITSSSIAITAPMVLINSSPGGPVMLPSFGPQKKLPDSIGQLMQFDDPTDAAAPDAADDGTKFDKM
jgi:type VI secretion system secreted protein VgrG